MSSLRIIKIRNGIYHDEKSISERRLKHERAINPVKAFIDKAMADNSLEEDFVQKFVLFDAYKRFCKKYKLPIKSSVGFGKDLVKLQNLGSENETKG
jgi:hypothetical protein